MIKRDKRYALWVSKELKELIEEAAKQNNRKIIQELEVRFQKAVDNSIVH